MLIPLLSRGGFLNRTWTSQHIGVSLTDEAAFFTGFTEADLTSMFNRKITITAANGLDSVYGYLKSVGSGSFGSEILTNGGFELGSTGEWEGEGDASLAVITSSPDPYEGTYAGKITGTKTGGGLIGQHLGGMGGKFVRVTWAAVSDNSNLLLGIRDRDGAFTTVISTTHLIADGWDNGEFWYNIQDDQSHVAMKFNTAGAARVGYIDGVSVKTMTPSASNGYYVTTTPGGTTYNWTKDIGGARPQFLGPYTVALTF